MNPMQHRRWYKVIAYILIFCLSITIFPNTSFAKQNEEKVEQEAVSESFDRDAVLEKAENYTTYDMGNGERKTVFHGGNIRYENEDGELEEYDPSLAEIESGDKTEQKKSLKGYSYTNAVGDKKHYVPEVLSEETPIRMEYEDYAIEFSLTKDSLKQLSVKDKEVEVEETMVQTAYEDDAKLPVNAVYGDESSLAEVTYTSCDDSIKETLVLNEIPTTNIFQYHIKLTGMEVKAYKNSRKVRVKKY